MEESSSSSDLTSELLDDCLALIFKSLDYDDRKSCSLVCRRWLLVESQRRQLLCLRVNPSIVSFISALFSRFDSVTTLLLLCAKLNDEILSLISIECRNLEYLEILGRPNNVTETGLAALAMHATRLETLSFMFEAQEKDDFANNGLRCHVKNSTDTELIGPVVATYSLKNIHMTGRYYPPYCTKRLAPLIIGSKNLRSLRLELCFGDWDTLFNIVAKGEINTLVEVYLDRVTVSDVGLLALSNCCSKLKELHITRTPNCTNRGIVSLVKHCKLLRKLCVDKCRNIREDILVALGKYNTRLEVFEYTEEITDFWLKQLKSFGKRSSTEIVEEDGHQPQIQEGAEERGVEVAI